MTTGADGTLEPLDLETSLEHLREHEVGRLGVVAASGPIVVPVNYRLVETAGLTWVAIRTKPGGLLDRPNEPVAFEIDGIGPGRQGWSVLVQGRLLPVDPDAADFRARFDFAPWLEQRDAWLAIEPSSITGRTLHPPGGEWAYSPAAYL